MAPLSAEAFAMLETPWRDDMNRLALLCCLLLAGCARGTAPESGCGDGSCSDDESCSSCALDCGLCTECGDGSCDLGETCDSCPDDCGDCTANCGDDYCATNLESCGDCPEDCGTCSLECGDGVCDLNVESCGLCPSDCGACTGDELCGDGRCVASDGEQCSTCRPDCGDCPSTPSNCGDRSCVVEQGESCSVCPADCGTCAYCSDGDCDAARGETCGSCPQDCGTCSGSCGDGTCDLDFESCIDCAQDCGACPADGVCGDGACVDVDGEDCFNCASDCGACTLCGNGVCDTVEPESCESCPADCGACETCGDGVCDALDGESCSTCAADCGRCNPCGDGICKGEETCETCRADCGACSRRGCIQGSFSVFHGNFHAHTAYSDGQATPEVAFQHARGAGLFFMWVTDHKGQMSNLQWDKCLAQARRKNVDHVFVAGCGYEIVIKGQSGPDLGHFNAMFTNRRMPTPVGLQDLYQTLANTGHALGQFNHPPWPGTFGGYQLYPVGKPGMRMIEFSGRGSWGDKMDAYFRALRNGWRISPSMNEDNHQRNWGDSRRATGVWADELTRSSLREGVEANRTFATTDESAIIAFKADGACWMGSVLHGFGSVDFSVVARDRQEADKFRRIELRGPNGGVIESHNCNGKNPCTARFSRKASAATFWVTTAVQEDGDTIVSAPIWLEQ